MVSNGSSDEYLIFHHDKIGFLDILSLLFLRRKLTSYKFVEASSATTLKLNNVYADTWLTTLVLMLQKALAVIKKPLNWIGIAVEYVLNLVSINGGLFGFVKNFLTISAKWPDQNSKEFRSFIGHIDGRTQLHKSVSVSSYFQQADPEFGLTEDLKQFDIFAMAAKVAYENEAYIREVVTQIWKKTFVEYFNCWNESLQAKTTQAFLFSDTLSTNPVFILAFRGTEPFNADDWSTDIDLSFRSLRQMGKAHAGFLNALGFPAPQIKHSTTELEDQTEDIVKPLAYNTIRDSLKNHLERQPNAQISITGHSLGGALAILFPALLKFHGEDDILKAIKEVITFGQPRVGDQAFADSMKSIPYYRVVYGFDIVPRIPPDLLIFSPFKHFGECFHYDDWYKYKLVKNYVPNPNYWDITFWPTMHQKAWEDLTKGMQMEGEYEEGFVSIMFRAFGLIIPGVASHSLRDYINAVRLGQLSSKEVMN